MRRPAKGGTTHPTQARPGMGYGRPLRPRPGPAAGVDLVTEVRAFLRGEPTVALDDAVLPEELSPIGELDLRS